MPPGCQPVGTGRLQDREGSMTHEEEDEDVRPH
jgi:hypothetical protein